LLAAAPQFVFQAKNISEEEEEQENARCSSQSSGSTSEGRRGSLGHASSRLVRLHHGPNSCHAGDENDEGDEYAGASDEWPDAEAQEEQQQAGDGQDEDEGVHLIAFRYSGQRQPWHHSAIFHMSALVNPLPIGTGYKFCYASCSLFVALIYSFPMHPSAPACGHLRFLSAIWKPAVPFFT
jgi:hypothetical protein